MELLIPGLILVALMVWASTKIKKTAADAFEAELIETERYTLQKPEGFLHVIGDEQHELSAYSREIGKNDYSATRQATIELDIYRDSDLSTVRDEVIRAGTRSNVTSETPTTVEIDSEESANEIALRVLYKIVSHGNDVYRLRFAVIPEHQDEYLRKIEETFDSFRLKTT